MHGKNNIKSNSKILVVLTLGAALGAFGLYGCASDKTPATPAASAGNHPSFALWGPAPQKSGVQLWSENCARCHNSRPPEEFSDAQWQTIVHHMRLRADLTGEEEREITKFLQSGN
jgi:hypothetical protein